MTLDQDDARTEREQTLPCPSCGRNVLQLERADVDLNLSGPAAARSITLRLACECGGRFRWRLSTRPGGSFTQWERVNRPTDDLDLADVWCTSEEAGGDREGSF